MSIGNHVMIRLASGQVLAPTSTQRRKLASIILYQARELGLLAFSVSDNHVHALLVCDHASATEFARRIELSWQALNHFGVPFAHCHIKPIFEQTHLYNTFFYILRQDQRHGTHLDPLREGNAVVDLLGVRVLGVYMVANVRAFLPRVTRADLLPYLGIEDLEGEIVDWGHLPHAAAAAFGLANLNGLTRLTLRALTTAAVLGTEQRPQNDIASLLGRSSRAVRRLLQRPAPTTVELDAVRRQIILRQHVLGARVDSVDPGLETWS